MPKLAESSQPNVLGKLTIDYAECRGTLDGRPMQLTAKEYGTLAKLSANAGRNMTHEQLLRLVWGQNNTGGSGPVRAIVKRLRRKLGDPADDPAYIFTKRRVGYWMEKGETPGDGSTV